MLQRWRNRTAQRWGLCHERNGREVAVVTTRKVTLIDVADRAGVSTTTASYILNGRSVEMRISHRATGPRRRL